MFYNVLEHPRRQHIVFYNVLGPRGARTLCLQVFEPSEEPKRCVLQCFGPSKKPTHCVLQCFATPEAPTHCVLQSFGAPEAHEKENVITEKNKASQTSKLSKYSNHPRFSISLRVSRIHGFEETQELQDLRSVVCKSFDLPMSSEDDPQEW